MFENAELDPTSLPAVEAVDLRPIDRNYFRVDLYATLILFAVLGVGLGVLYYFADFDLTSIWGWLLPVLYLVLLTFAILLARKRYRMIGFALRERDIVFRSGIFWRTLTVLPFNRVQHVEIGEGPIERSFGLSTLNIFTAGGESSDLSIPGLPKATATRLKDFIAEKTAADV